MVDVTLRSVKGSALTHNEVDTNFSNLKTGAENAIYSDPDSHDADYTFVLADAGKTIYATASNGSTRTWTIPLNSSVAFPVGTLIRLANLSTYAITIVADSTSVLYWMDGTDAAVADANRTLERRGMATIQQLDTDVWLIEGNAGLY